MRLLLLILTCLLSGSLYAQEPSAPAPAPVGASAAPAPGPFFYFCQRSNAYYPHVVSCPEGWIAVPAGPAIPVAEWPLPPPPATVETLRSQPNAITFELFGRALLYSLDYDRAISPHLTLGMGVSTWEMDNWWSDSRSNVTVVPVYGNYYFSENPSRGFVSVGADWIAVTHAGYNDDAFANNGFAATVGGGYEVRTSGGFLLRLGGFAIIGRSVDLNPSVDLGFAF